MAKKEPLLIDNAAAKRWLRKYLIRERQSISAALQRKRSAKIIQTLVRHPLFKKSKVIASFIGFASEVITDGLIEEAWARGKKVVIPITSEGFERPTFALFRKGDALTKTERGPLELVEKKKPFNFGLIDLVLVPGLGFDPAGYRLGYGGGVYDRILQKTPRASHVGLFFSSQEISHIPVNLHDRPMTMVMTEKEIREWR